MPSDVFQQIIKNNAEVNQVVNEFTNKLEATQKDTINYMSIKNAFNFWTRFVSRHTHNLNYFEYHLSFPPSTAFAEAC
jgi:hypothetical protein